MTIKILLKFEIFEKREKVFHIFSPDFGPIPFFREPGRTIPGTRAAFYLLPHLSYLIPEPIPFLLFLQLVLSVML